MAKPKAERFAEGKWRGKPRYYCGLCPFETHSKVVVREHLDRVHPEGKP